MTTNAPTRISSRRKMRRLNKYRGMLLCENCNRYGNTSMYDWEELTERELQKGIGYIFLCNRRSCKISRPENLIDEDRYNVTKIQGGLLLEKIYH